MPPRVIAVDWSGAVDGAHKKIWLAEVTADGRVVRLESGRDRTAMVRHLIDEASRASDLVVGIDFAFSMPGWFLIDRKLTDAPALWELAEQRGEEWLADCEPPFWGRAGRGRPDLPEHLRITDRRMPVIDGIQPKSVFQINGGGSVGTGSIRGMPILAQLRRAGFAVWPFDAPRFPMVVEIYPRVLTGSVRKGNEDERRRYCESNYPELDAQVVADAASSEDAFDALISALVMAAHATEFATLAPATDSIRQLEGEIWLPQGEIQPVLPARGRYNSSKTRVAPVFAALEARAGDEPQWIRRLLELVGENRDGARWRTEDLALQTAHYEPNERPLLPPIGLLSWLVRNFDAPVAKLSGQDAVVRERRKLAAKDSATIERALDLLRRAGGERGWYVLEGPTYPDVLLVTTDALVVIEGKRTEAGPTTSTTWMSGRHQMLRHLDAAWEIRGRRSVYGFFVVEADPGGIAVPSIWTEAARATLSEAAIEASLPHRSSLERAGIAASFLGVTTWQALVESFGLDASVLVETVESSITVSL